MFQSISSSGALASQLARSICRRYSVSPVSSLFWHHTHPSSHSQVEVCFADPKLVLESQGKNVACSSISTVSSSVSQCLLHELSKGVNELGDTDDPMNNWYFGKTGEIFQYHLVGTHPAPSGFTSVIAKSTLEDILAGSHKCALPSWPEFVQLLDSGAIQWPTEKLPFLFAGRVVDSAAAAVYELRDGTHVLGLMVSSEAFS